MAAGLEKGTRKPRADVVRNRERLLAAAVTVFRNGGPEASLEAVARCAEVGIGTLYRHFPTREALFEAVYRREVEDMARLAESLADAPDPVQALRQWSRAGIRLVATKRGMLTALALAVDKSSDVYAFSFEHLTRAIGLLLGTCMAANLIRDDITPEDLLHALVGMSMMGKEPGWEANVVRLLDIFIDGLLQHEI
ncbi:transcriptional regulator [Aureimonas sp. Leaf454]|uniref:TetR/AcrR family transcriptional regulator n=1 Tax=Aureimonas sp. Leaf454 TaxID=1736381 RepID=UPI0006FB9E72|nr:TetR family transcriptional regulator [Aureimonas sp. Leaf454]KQT44575.1 transcriptional regulator [Aureimonas sp. Leaf454]